MTPLTVYLGKLLGVFCIIIALAMMGHASETVVTITALIHDQAALFVVELVTVAIGLAMVIGHNIWRSGVFPFVVTLMGWLTLLKGLVLLCLPSAWMTRFYEMVQYDRRFFLFMGVMLVIGLYLTMAAFFSRGPAQSAPYQAVRIRTNHISS